MITLNEAERLKIMLKANCPYDTGSLEFSIKSNDAGTKYIIEIGGPNINPKSKTATSVYSSIVNYARTNHGHTNLNYHWIEKTIEQWGHDVSEVQII